MAFYAKKIISDQIFGALIGQSTSAISASYSATASNLAEGASVSSASFAETASFAYTASYIESSSYALTATSASVATTASYVESASFATTASYVLSSSFATTASYVESASFATSASLSLSSSYALSSSFATSASSATSASYALSSSYSVTASFATSASYALSASAAESSSYALSASFATSASWARSASFATTASHAVTASYLDNRVYDREVHVSGVSGNDSGSGTLLQPVKTIARAIALSNSSGMKIIIHPGTYGENVTLTSANLSVSAANPEQGGIVYLSGSFTINNNSTSIRLAGITMNTLIITGSGGAYLDQCRVNTSFQKLGSGFLEVLNSGIQPTSGMTISAGTNTIVGGNIAGIVQSGASTITIVKNAMSLTYANITAGTFAVTDSPVYSITSGSAAILSSAGSIVQLFNTQVATPTGVPEKIAISGFFGYNDLWFNKDASTLGTSLALTADFQNIRGTLIGTASFATTASTANNFLVKGDLMVNGTASFKQVNFLSSSVVYSSGSTKFGDSMDDTHQFTGSMFITGSITGTASYATQASQSFLATSASLAQTASFVVSASNALTASNLSALATASYALTSSYTISSSNALTASYLDAYATASYALTASYVANASSFPYTGSAAITGSLTVIGDVTAANFLGTASWALTASYLSGSVKIDTGSLLTTASFNEFTASAATTGSNQFKADQTVSGSLNVSGSLVLGDWRLLPSGSNLAVEKWNGAAWIQSGYFEI